MLLKDIKKNLLQSYAFFAKSIKLKLRFKFKFWLNFVSPLWNFIMPLIIFGTIFRITNDAPIGIWNSHNFILFFLLGFCAGLTSQFSDEYHMEIIREKYWKTLQAFFMAPVNRMNILFGIIMEEFVILSVPVSVVFVVLLITFPTSFISFMLALLIFLSAAIFLASIGLIMGALSLFSEGAMQWAAFLMHFVMLFSCYNYPREIFPDFLTGLIIFNPLYYYWDLLRIIWLFGFDYVIANPTYFVHFVVIISLTIICPIISVILFNYFYKKFGIIGY